MFHGVVWWCEIAKTANSFSLESYSLGTKDRQNTIEFIQGLGFCYGCPECDSNLTFLNVFQPNHNISKSSTFQYKLRVRKCTAKSIFCPRGPESRMEFGPHSCICLVLLCWAKCTPNTWPGATYYGSPSRNPSLRSHINHVASTSYGVQPF